VKNSPYCSAVLPWVVSKPRVDYMEAAAKR
jgi:hypothetical protein